uniref:ERCC6L2-like ribbon-helix-helix domain-containing protein n=1 Tax=Eptatretus burgeri TaxID=7764 RepID=A0A8C4QIU2_EPTBU
MGTATSCAVSVCLPPIENISFYSFTSLYSVGAALQAREAEKLHIESTDFVFGQTPMAVCRSHFVALAHHSKLSEQALAHKILTANEEQRLQLLESFYSSRYTELLRTQRKVLCKPRGKITTTRMRIIVREAEKSCHPFSSDSDSESSACKDPVQRAEKSEKSIRQKSSSQFDPGRKKTTNKPQRVSWKTRKHRRLLDTDEGSTTSDDFEPDGKRVEMMEKVAETQKVCDNVTRSSLPLCFDIVRAHGTEETARSNAVSVPTDPSVNKMADAANPKPEPSNPSKDLHAEQPSDCQPVQGGEDELAELLGDTSILNSLFTASQKRRPSSGNRIRNNDYRQRITRGDKEDETGNSHVRTTNADTESICDINLGAFSVMENREGFDTGNNLENGAEVTPGVNCEHRDDSSRGGFAPRRQNGMDDFIAQLLNNPNLSCPKDSQRHKKTAQVHRPKVSSPDDGWDPRMWRKNESFFLCRREEK